jgi:tetratricopeptide (TPR) repeat protein
MPFEQRPYLALAAFYAAAGQPARAREMLGRWDSEMTDTVMKRVRDPDRRAIRGAIELSEGKYAEALRSIWSADTTYDGPNGTCDICVLDDIGLIHSQAGNADSAIVYFERYLAAPFYSRQNFDAGARPLIHKRLGELYEATGNVEKAALNYRAFLALWDKADPRLQPKVEDARRRLSRLADVEGGRRKQ